jgi:hypothetical protein
MTDGSRVTTYIDASSTIGKPLEKETRGASTICVFYPKAPKEVEIIEICEGDGDGDECDVADREIKMTSTTTATTTAPRTNTSAADRPMTLSSNAEGVKPQQSLMHTGNSLRDTNMEYEYECTDSEKKSRRATQIDITQWCSVNRGSSRGTNTTTNINSTGTSSCSSSNSYSNNKKRTAASESGAASALLNTIDDIPDEVENCYGNGSEVVIYPASSTSVPTATKCRRIMQPQETIDIASQQQRGHLHVDQAFLSPWICTICTYAHRDTNEWGYLQCAVCGSLRDRTIKAHEMHDTY